MFSVKHISFAMGALWIVAGIPPASAADAQCAAVVMGYSGVTCGKLLDARERREELQVQMYLAFFTGFITGRNAYGRGNANPGDTYAIKAFVDEYCRLRPLDNLLMAGKELVRQSGPPSEYDCEQ